jgi:integrase
VPLIAFYLATGMRRNEAINLEWQHVNFESGVIAVARAKGRRPRLIPLSPLARRILEGRKGRSKPFDWYPSSINRMWLCVRKEAKVPDVKIHDLRKTFGTLLAQAGVSSLLTQNWMGHTDPRVTREH